jgi:RNA polymerase sporulation-specific sigma factor
VLNRAEAAEVTDDTMLAAARAGDPAAMEHLLNKYRDLVRIRARNYFMIGGDRDDIIQEGMIGLYKAVRDFRAEKLASFRVFAELCITRQIITAIKTATRLKHVPLNQYVSLNKPAFRDDSDRTLIDVLESPKNFDPEDLLIKQEFSDDVWIAICPIWSRRCWPSISRERAIARCRASSTGTQNRSITPCSASSAR